MSNVKSQMSFPEALSQVVHCTKIELQAITEFINFAEKIIIEKHPFKPSAPFTPEELTQISKYVDLLHVAVQTSKKMKSGSSPKLIGQSTHTDHVGKYLSQTWNSIKYRSFLFQMTLSYLVSHQEAFIKDYLLQILLHKRSILKSDNSITYEDLSNYHSVKSIWASLAAKKVKSLSSGGIDDVAVYFKKQLNIDLAKFPDWCLLREASFRRNLIIHNKGKIDEVYMKKLRLKTNHKPLTTDMAYISSVIQTFLGFIEFTHTATKAKFKL